MANNDISDETFKSLLGAVDEQLQAQPRQGSPQAPSAPEVSSSPQMSDEDFQKLLEQTGKDLDAKGSRINQPQLPTLGQQDPDGSNGGAFPTGDPEAASQPTDKGVAGNTTSFLDAGLGGALKAGFETKDFLLGAPEASDYERLVEGSNSKSTFRNLVEQGTAQVDDGSMANTFVTGLSQFAVGMLGAGKLLAGAKLIKGVGAGLDALGATRAGTMATESLKAAAVGATVFDPHGQRLSNLIQDDLPSLSNPVTEYLQAKPGDSAALGRAKNALESLGLDAAFVGLFAASVQGLKILRGTGSAAEKQAAMEALEQAHQEYRGGEVSTSSSPAGGEAASSAPGMPEGSAPSAPKGLERPEASASEASTSEASPTEVPTSDGSGVSPKTSETEAPPSSVGQGAEQTAKPEASAPDAQTSSPPQAQTPEGTPPASAVEPDAIDPETISKVFTATSEDAQALIKYGSWDAAVANGHVFGKGGTIPWQKLNVTGSPTRAVDALMDRLAEARQAELDAAKGGDVMSDATVQQMVEQRANLMGEDPAQLLGMLQAAGDQAQALAANMEAGFLVSQKALQDAYTLAARIKIGYLDEFGGSLEAANAALKTQVEIAAQAYGSARSIMSNSGRALRRMRGEFAIKPSDLEAMRSMDAGQLADLINATGGDPRELARAINPSFLSTVRDWASYLYANNLLWGWKTHTVNFLSNAYMLTARPLERLIGSIRVGGDEAGRIRAESFRQYALMASSIGDAWDAAVQTWKLGDSVLSPHATEALTGPGTGGSIGQTVAQMAWRPNDSIANIAYNALLLPTAKVLGAPTRALGAADELMKQMVYRSRVETKAITDGMEQGLTGDELAAYAKSKLLDAFDDAGRALDPAAFQEAQIATFQQDLVPGTIGSDVAAFTARHPMARFVLPFVKTPTNVFRYGWKMTPGLNYLQGEYRSMLQGKMGAEAQAQAFGQMALGTLFMGTAATLAATGSITGGGPAANPKLMKQLTDTGWQPYSFVTVNPDGSKTYTSFDHLDPVGMPFGIVADIVTALAHGDDTPGYTKIDTSRDDTLASLAVALAKSIANRTYLQSLKQVTDGVFAPDRSAGKVAGNILANLIPGSSASGRSTRTLT